MKVLVIGKSGQLASSFRHIDHQNQLKFLGQRDFNYLSQESIFKNLDNCSPDILINCAAYTKVDLAETQKEECRALNVDFVKNLALWCEQNQKKIIHFSTDYVFDGKKTEPYREEDPTCPINWYGKTKAFGEEILMGSQAEAIIFRVSWLYSQFGHNFLKTMIHLGQTKENISVVDDQIGAPCYAVNVAEVIYSWIFTKNLKGVQKGIYHLAPQNRLSWYDFAKEIFKAYQEQTKEQGLPPLKLKELKGIKTKDYPTATRRPLNSRLDSRKVDMALGVKLEDILISLKRIIHGI